MTDKEAIGQIPAPAEGCPKGCEANAKLQAAMLATQTLGELYALMEDYSYLEFMAVYKQLPASQQAVLDKICDRDTIQQITALNRPKFETSHRT